MMTSAQSIVAPSADDLIDEAFREARGEGYERLLKPRDDGPLPIFAGITEGALEIELTTGNRRVGVSWSTFIQSLVSSDGGGFQPGAAQPSLKTGAPRPISSRTLLVLSSESPIVEAVAHLKNNSIAFATWPAPNRPGCNMLAVAIRPELIDSSPKGLWRARAAYAWMAGLLAGILSEGRGTFRFDLSRWRPDDLVFFVGGGVGEEGCAVDQAVWLRETGFEEWLEAHPQPGEQPMGIVLQMPQRGINPANLRNPGDASKRPVIDVGEPLHVSVKAAIAALAGVDDIFVHNERLVEMTNAKIRTLSLDSLPVVLSAAASWQKYTAKGAAIDSYPPPQVVRGVLAQGAWPGVRRLAGVSELPVLRADGSVAVAEGYDPASRIYLALGGVRYEVAPRPTQEDARKAAQRLLRFAAGANFADPSGSSIWLSLVLTLVARRAIDGSTPVHVFDAPINKWGKSTIAVIAYILVFGREPEAEECKLASEEIDKRMPMWANKPLVFFDNIPNGQEFSGSALDRILTNTHHTTRALGRNEAIDVDLSGTAFAATGNKFKTRDDTATRVIVARLNKPSGDWPFPAKVHYLGPRRAEAVGDALTVLRAYILASKPRTVQPNSNRFDAWSDLVRSAIVWAGQPDPVDNVSIEDQGDEHRREAMRQLYRYTESQGWDEFRAMQILTGRREREFTPGLDDLLNSLHALRHKKIETPADVGYAFKDHLMDVPVDEERCTMTLRRRKRGKDTFFSIEIVQKSQDSHPEPGQESEYEA